MSAMAKEIDEPSDIGQPRKLVTRMDEPRSVKDGARGTEERALTLSEPKSTFETHCETDEYFHASINAEMLTISVRTHADCTERASMVSIRTVVIVVRVRCLARRREPDASYQSG